MSFYLIIALFVISEWTRLKSSTACAEGTSTPEARLFACYYEPTTYNYLPTLYLSLFSLPPEGEDDYP